MFLNDNLVANGWMGRWVRGYGQPGWYYDNRVAQCRAWQPAAYTPPGAVNAAHQQCRKDASTNTQIQIQIQIHTHRGSQRCASTIMPKMQERCKYEYKYKYSPPRGVNVYQLVCPTQLTCKCNFNNITFSNMPAKETNFVSVAISNRGSFFEYISRMYATMNAGVSSVLQELEMFASATAVCKILCIVD